jgi:CBS domain-containing protein
MKTVRQILDAKGHDYWHVPMDSTVYEALRLMAEQEIGSVLVMEAGELKGILTERDYARKVVLEGLTSPELPVERIMATHVLYARPDQTVEECMALMTDKRVRHLPVLDGGHVVGVVSIGDLVKATIDEQQFIIEQLEQYIAG